MQKTENWIKKLDLISNIPSAKLTFGKDTDHKTVVGGICTLLAIAGFLLVVIVQGHLILFNKQPYVSSNESPFTDYDWNMKIKDGSKVVFSVQSWGSAFELDKSKIHAYI